jgi:uncharacterized membrane protein YjgN (DUF898 family)
MKNYFDLKLKGSQIFVPVMIGWLVYCFFLIIYFHYVVALANPFAAQALLLPLWSSVLLLMLVIPVTYLYIMKAMVQGTSYKDEALRADYNVGKFIGIVIVGTLLTIVTLGIYSPWFERKIINFFAKGTSYRGQPLEFKGKGITLFAITILALMLPLVIIIAIGALLFGKIWTIDMGLAAALIMVLLVVLLYGCIAVYTTLYYKWCLNFTYGSKRIVSYVDGAHGSLFILGQLLLCIITLGFWIPAALLRIYRYFADRLVVGTDKVEGEFGFEFTETKDYLFILGQYFLTLITLGIYFPWAAAKVACRFANQTFVKELENPTEAMPAND